MSQISHIKYKDVIEAGRYDADYFLPDFIKTKEKLSSIPHVTFGDKNITSLFVKGVFDIGADNYCDNGVPFVRISNLKNQTIDTSDIVYIPEDINEKNKKTELKYGDIILSKTGGPACSFVDIEKCNTSQDTIAVKIKKDNGISTRFLTIFFNSKYGELQLLRAFTGNVQMHLSLDEGKKILIPKFSENFQDIIDNLFDSSLEKRKLSKQLYQEAEDLLLTELGLKNHTISHTLTFSTTKKAVDEAGRYDADYFQPKYDELIEKIENYKGGWDYVENLFKYKKGFEPGAEAYTQEGIDFIRVSDFTKFGIDGVEKKISEKMYDELKENYQAKKGEILFTKDGTIGITYVLKEDLKGIISSAFLRLNLKEEYENQEKECLALILNSIICKLQVERFSGGALISHLKPSDFEKIKIPLINSQLQKEISDKIKESFKLRNESKELLEQAKKMVEDEIEKE